MKTCKYGNFVAASSSSDHLEGKKTEGFILPPQKSSQTPSENFMNFCDEIVQNSKPVSHEEGHSHSGFGFKSGSNGENYPTPAGANNTNADKYGNFVSSSSTTQSSSINHNNGYKTEFQRQIHGYDHGREDHSNQQV